MDSTTAVPTAPPRRNTDSSADSLSEHEDVSSLASGWSEDDQSESQGDGQPREDSTTPTPVVPVLTSLLAVSTPAQDVETLRINTWYKIANTASSRLRLSGYAYYYEGWST